MKIGVKKIYVLLIMLLTLMSVSCSKESIQENLNDDNIETVISEVENDYEVGESVSETIALESELQAVIESHEETSVENAEVDNNFDSSFYFYEDIEFPDKIKLEHELVQSNEKGELYLIKINFDEEFEARDYNGHDRLILGYFYIEDDVVYYLDEIDRSADVTIDSILLNGKIIFADQEYYKSLNIESKENDYLEFKDDSCIHHYYTPDDEKGYYRTVGWDKEHGLIIFRNGFGCEMETIILYREGVDIERYE